MDNDQILTHYVQYLRAPFFTGFLTITGLIFSVTTFIITNLLKDIYTSETYKDAARQAKFVSPTANLTTDIRAAKKRLMWCMCITLSASFCQMTVGFVHDIRAVFACMGAAFLGAIATALSVYFANLFIGQWFKWLDDNHGPNSPAAREKVAKQRKEMMGEFTEAESTE